MPSAQATHFGSVEETTRSEAPRFIETAGGRGYRHGRRCAGVEGYCEALARRHLFLCSGEGTAQP
ncbi:MAG: hypothetical protein ACREOH_18840, partial [Candidatus Entotheonellia bacterium]